MSTRLGLVQNQILAYALTPYVVLLLSLLPEDGYSQGKDVSHVYD